MSGCEERDCPYCVTLDEDRDEDREEWCVFGAVPCYVISECGIAEQLKEQKC